ncbi:MAG: class I SAM-dependent methyltransferase [Anaerolineaceae bacterium]
MLPETTARLLDLNRQFYQNFARPFANTRRRIQPGVRRILSSLDLNGDWLDLGCGSGALALEWIRQFKQRGCIGGSYLGLDFSAGLLAEAGSSLPALPAGLKIDFQQADLSQPDWDKSIQSKKFNGAMSFAVLHHLPGEALRQAVMKAIRGLLPPGGLFIHSEWQFQNSPRLLERVLDWSSVGMDPQELDPGDTLLDWRHTLPGQPDRPGLRYVHRFDAAELERVASASGFEIVETFESDGQGGRLGLYHVWQAT